MTTMEKKGDVTRFATEFLMGGVSAAVSKTAAAPIERIKLLMQNEGAMLKSGRLDRPYDGIIDCFKRTVAKEGYLSLWRGNTANVYRYFPTQALNFAIKDQIKRVFAVPKDAPYAKQFTSNIAAGGLAGAASLTIVYSLDYARTRLANDITSAETGGKRQFSGLADVYKKTYQSDGFTGLYRGFGLSVVGIMIYRGLYFGLYDSLKPVVHKVSDFKEDSSMAVGLTFLLGWGITIVAGLAGYPIDTVRRHIQSIAYRMMMTSGEKVKYSSSVQAFSEIIRQEGVKALFKGCGANVIRAIAGAGVLTGYDQLQLVAFGKAYSGGSG